MIFSEEQNVKGFTPICITESGMETEVRESQE